jgi:hypothetical protein
VIVLVLGVELHRIQFAVHMVSLAGSPSSSASSITKVEAALALRGG